MLTYSQIVIEFNYYLRIRYAIENFLKELDMNYGFPSTKREWEDLGEALGKTFIPIHIGDERVLPEEIPQ